MYRKVGILAVMLCLALFGVGSTLALGAGAVSGGASTEISAPVDNTEGTGSPTPAETEVEDDDEPILTIVEEVWEVVADTSGTIVELMFGLGI